MCLLVCVYVCLRVSSHRIRLRPRILRDVSVSDTRTTVQGNEISFPVGIAPTAFHCLAWHEGEMATARGEDFTPIRKLILKVTASSIYCKKKKSCHSRLTFSKTFKNHNQIQPLRWCYSASNCTKTTFLKKCFQSISFCC